MVYVSAERVVDLYLVTLVEKLAKNASADESRTASEKNVHRVAPFVCDHRSTRAVLVDGSRVGLSSDRSFT
jgi:hypothetical protein